MSVESIVNVTIDSNSLSGAVKAFNRPLVVARHSKWTERAKVYSSSSAKAQLISEGFAVTGPVYKAVVGCFSGNNSPDKVVLGRLTGTFSQLGTLEIIGTPYEGQIYAFNLRAPDGTLTAISHTVSSTPDTLTEIAASIASKITAVTDITATNTDAVVNWEADNDNEVWAFEGLNGANYLQFVFKDTTVAPTDVTLAADLSAIKGANKNWYGLQYAGAQSDAINTAIASWAEDEEKIFTALNHNDNERDSTDATRLSQVLYAAGRFRTTVCYSQDQTANLVSSLYAAVLPTDPGSATWEDWVLSGVTGDIIDADAEEAMTRCAYYAKDFGGYSGVTQNMKVAGGEFIDVVVFRDWCAARLRETVLNTLINVLKVPYTEAGKELFLQKIRGVLRQGVTKGGIDPDEEIVVTGPAIVDVPLADRQGRLLPDIHAGARLAGAIHALNLNISLYV